MVTLSLTGLTDALKKYFDVKVDTAHPERSFAQSKPLLDEIDLNETELAQVLQTVHIQDELERGAPSLDAIQKFDTALRPWISVRKEFYKALDQCPTGTAGQDCQAAAFTAYERKLNDTIPAVADAYKAMLSTAPRN